MNTLRHLVDLYSSININAGGPGSGRHPEAGKMDKSLKKSGWVVQKTGATNLYNHPDRPGHQVSVNQKTGDWSHTRGRGKSYNAGNRGLHSLNNHLIYFHSK